MWAIVRSYTLSQLLNRPIKITIDIPIIWQLDYQLIRYQTDSQ